MPAGPGNWRSLLDAGRARLEQAGVAEASNKLNWVAGHLLKCGLLDVLRHLDRFPAAGQAEAFAAAVARLERDEPVQYVIGETDFMGLPIRCDARALIPRPETEELAAAAAEFLAACPGRPVAVDACTGTGCIACALARRVPRARIRATDISAAALALARSNAQALGAAVEFRQADLLEGLPDGSADLVVANPPYVASAVCDRLDRTVRDFEPRLALDGGPDGLRVISRLVSGAARVLTSGGRLMLEIGDDQADAVMELLCQTPLFMKTCLRSDSGKHPRVVITARRPR